jgi:glycosyltransferase involved in cell wall biosynthesis
MRNHYRKNKKKHILFIVENSFVPHDVRVWSEAQAARKWGYRVSVICPKGMEYKKTYENLRGVHVYRHPRCTAKKKNDYFLEYTMAMIWEALFTFYVFLKHPFQVLHGANPPDHLFAIAMMYKIFGVKYIFDHHDLAPESYRAKFMKKGILFKILLAMEKLSFKLSDAVVSTNESYKSVAIERGGKGGDKVSVIRNGPDLSEIYYPEANGGWKKGFDYLVAYIGVIGVQDQLEVLLRIIDHIVNEMNEKRIKFIIIGTGSNFDNIVKMAGEMKLNSYIEFTGFIPYADVYEIFSTADACVNPELKNEFTDKSTMIKVMEYMSFGKPIVQFDTVEGRVTAQDAAVHIEENDELKFARELVALVKDTEKKRKLGEIGRRRVQEFLQWDIQKQELKKVYERLLPE